MDTLWQEFLDVLADMLSAYQKMLDLSKEKREALIAAKVKEIEGITKQEQTLLIFLGQCEKRRVEMMEQIAQHYQLSPEELHLSNIKQFVEEKFQHRLEEIEEQFHTVATNLQQLNEMNNELIQQALHFVNYNINVLTQNVANMNYAARGQQEQSTAKTVFDRKI